MARTACAILATLAVLAGCGKSTPDDDVRTTLEGFGRAIAARDYQALCDVYFSSRLISGLLRAGLPCEAAIRPEIGATEKPKLTIRSIEVDGETARARVYSEAANQPPSDDTIALTLEDGRWRVASLAEAGPQPLGP